jgi:hypothetical protein
MAQPVKSRRATACVPSGGEADGETQNGDFGLNSPAIAHICR